MKDQQNKSPHEVVEDMVVHLIEEYVRKPPYIAIVSKRQLWFGNGIFKGMEDSKSRGGLRKFMGIRIPTDVEVEKKSIYYGYPALVKPWSHLNNITNHAMRQRILWRTIDGKELSDVRPLLGKGYIREDGKLDPEQTKGISCYVFFLADPEVRDVQNAWIAGQPKWKRWQILRNQMTHRELLTEKRKQASTLVRNNGKLLEYDEYRELNPSVDRKAIPWEDYE
ncbi:MAG: hypothetical protein ACYSW3_00435 [Planctomycetota bacterium]|jgi:hypothetical protein